MILSFDEVFEDKTKYGTKIKTSDYLDVGAHIIIDQGQEQIAGYTNQEDGLYCDVPAIVFGDHTRIIKYVDEPFFLGADGVKVLQCRFENANYKYLYYVLKNARIPNTGYNRHFKWLKETQIPYPDMTTQAKIIDVLERVEAIIAKHKQELCALDDLIKARFVEMFGDVIRNDKGWTQYLFSDIATSRLGKMLDAKQQTGENRFPYLANFNVQWFRFNLTSLNEMDFDKDDQAEFELRDGDLLVCEGGEIGRCAVWHNEVQPCFFQKALHRVRCNNAIVVPDYLARWFQYNCEHGGFASIEGAKATISHLPGAKLKLLQVTVPPIDLQQQFVSFVAQIDKSKSVIQKSLAETQTLFASLMQQYFG